MTQVDLSSYISIIQMAFFFSVGAYSVFVLVIIFPLFKKYIFSYLLYCKIINDISLLFLWFKSLNAITNFFKIKKY